MSIKNLTHSPCALVRARSVDEVPDAQACEPEFHPWSSRKGGRKELTPSCCPLMYIHHATQTCAHMYNSKNVRDSKCAYASPTNSNSWNLPYDWLHLAYWAETYLGGCLSWMAVILKGKGKFIVDHQSLTRTHSEKSIPVLWHKSCGNCEKQKLVPVRTLYAFIHRKIWKHRETVTSGSLRRVGMGTEEPIWTPACLHCLNVFLPLLTSFFIFNHE